MRHLMRLCVAVFLGLGLFDRAEAAKPPARPTHLLQATFLDVATTQPNGDPWDNGVGAYLRPDPQITLVRQDAQAIERTAQLLVQVIEQDSKDSGRPIVPELRGALLKSAYVQLRCGATIAALDDAPLTQARAQFAADTTVATDTFSSSPSDGGLKVALGDKIGVFVNEVDLAYHDSMGEFEIEITKDLLKKGEIELKFGSVKSLRLKIALIGK